VVPAQALDPVLARQDALLRELVGNETVPERRIVGMDVQGGVDQVRIGPVPVPSPGWLSTGSSLAC
jgi:hypothetical protein